MLGTLMLTVALASAAAAEVKTRVIAARWNPPVQVRAERELDGRAASRAASRFTLSQMEPLLRPPADRL
jgi:hypothetical protein